MKKALALAVLALGGGVVLYLEGSMEATLNHLTLKYPYIDRKIAKKVYRRMILNVTTGTLGVEINDDTTEDEMDEIFMARYTQAVLRK